jgi:hypothetical protein
MTKSSKKLQPQQEIELKPKKSFSLKLSKQELVHLRDLFGVMLPADMKSTVSQSLASSQDRQLVESKLWNKIISLCSEAEVPMGEYAPDFVISISAPPQLNVFEMISEEESEVSSVVQQILEEDDSEE